MAKRCPETVAGQCRPGDRHYCSYRNPGHIADHHCGRCGTRWWVLEVWP